MVQIMAWRRPDDKPLSELMMVSFWRIYASLSLNELKIAWKLFKRIVVFDAISRRKSWSTMMELMTGYL